MTTKSGFQNQSRIAQNNFYELDGQEQEALISLRDARRKLQHATKSRRFYPEGGGRTRSAEKSIDELKKVTPCNRCGAFVTGKQSVHNLPEAERRDPLRKRQRKNTSVQEKT